MKKEYTFNAKHIELIKAFTTNKDYTKPTLHCVRFEEKRILATDGYIAMIINHDQNVTSPITINGGSLTSNKSISESIAIEDNDDGTVTIKTVTKDGLIEQRTENIKEVYPPIDNIIPEIQEKDLRVKLSIELLERILKASKKIKSDSITLHFNNKNYVGGYMETYLEPVRFELSGLEGSKSVIATMK